MDETTLGGENDPGEEPWYVNRYYCAACKLPWEDEHDCMCNDRCPKCNAEIEPYVSLDQRGELLAHVPDAAAFEKERGIEPL